MSSRTDNNRWKDIYLISDSYIVLLLALKNTWISFTVLPTNKLESWFCYSIKGKHESVRVSTKTQSNAICKRAPETKWSLVIPFTLFRGSKHNVQEAYEPDPLRWYDTVTPSYYTHLYNATLFGIAVSTKGKLVW